MSGNINAFNNANLEQRIADIWAGILKEIIRREWIPKDFRIEWILIDIGER